MLNHVPEITSVYRPRGICLAALLISLAGCADVDLPDDTSAADTEGSNDRAKDAREDAEVLEKVVALGFDPDAVELEGDVIRVDGDVILHRSELLAGSYAPPPDFTRRTEKGYRRTALVSGTVASNIKLVFDTGTYAPSQRIKDAFTAAALNWSGVSLSAIRISAAKTGPSITIKMLDSFLWPGSTGCGALSDACADYPSSGNPGAVIWIKRETNTDPSIDPCDWTTSTLDTVARHELGHAVGFMHPKEAGAVQISGTMSCGGTSSTCPGNPGYSTVMKSFVATSAYPACASLDPTTITADDIASIATVY